MNKAYQKRLIELAKEIKKSGLLEKMYAENKSKTSWNTMKLNAKINYLIGYILALEGEK